MKPYQVKQLHSGDEVFWTDPDDGLCSRHYVISEITIKDSGWISIIDKDGSQLECFSDELS